jgi:predicted NAD/FAD-dependent oxidoreductase
VGEYDHGAQYFTVRDPRFERRVESWIEDGLVAEWKGRFISVKNGARRAVSEKTRCYVGVPEMNSVAAHLAADCQVRTRLQVSAITRQGREWALRHEHGEDGPFDFMILAVPAPQAVPLLAASPRMQSQVAEVRMNGCSAVLLGLDAPLEVHFDGAFVNEGPLSWIARNRSKPGRQTETWVLHAFYAWTEHLESEPDRVSDRLVEAFQAVA